MAGFSLFACCGDFFGRLVFFGGGGAFILSDVFWFCWGGFFPFCGG